MLDGQFANKVSLPSRACAYLFCCVSPADIPQPATATLDKTALLFTFGNRQLATRLESCPGDIGGHTNFLPLAPWADLSPFEIAGRPPKL